MTDYIEDLGRPKSLLDHLESADPEIAERLVSRRTAILKGAGTSATVAAGLGLASTPVALAVLARDAFGQSARLPSVVIQVLNFALTLEYLEATFYTTGTGTSGLIPGSDQTIFNTITSHETQHVTALQQALGSSARPKPTFDFTGGSGSGRGPYADVFTNYATFTAVAQAFEDTGVRAYKGQAPALMPYPSVLNTALSIHSVEARHASEVRRLRGGFQNLGPYGKGWITGNQTDVPGASATYAGEDNTMQGGLDITTLGVTAPSTAFGESFDEPLTMQQVLAIAGNFIAS